MRNENVFREARTIALHCSPPDRAIQLRTRCDECKEVFDRFNISASREDFSELVAHWTRLIMAMDVAGPYVQPPSPRGGKLPLPRDFILDDEYSSVG